MDDIRAAVLDVTAKRMYEITCLHGDLVRRHSTFPDSHASTVCSSKFNLGICKACCIQASVPLLWSSYGATNNNDYAALRISHHARSLSSTNAKFCGTSADAGRDHATIVVLVSSIHAGFGATLITRSSFLVVESNQVYSIPIPKKMFPASWCCCFSFAKCCNTCNVQVDK
eukprot:2962142-Pleurochrysis_carterae.AAC.2